MATDSSGASAARKHAHWMLLLLGLAAAFLLGELTLRVLLRPSVRLGQQLGLHGYLGNQSSDDIAYRLALRYSLEGRAHDDVGPEFHPIFGWTGDVTEDNPLGLVTDQPYSLDSLRDEKTVLFFGDSFVRGYTDMRDKIPQLLDAALDDLTVLNFGVNGYGLDQMYLRLLSVIDDFEDAHVIVGILYDDIDRLVFPVRSRPKPYYQLDGSDIELRGVPIPPNSGMWLERFPPKKASYLLSAMAGMVRRVMNSRWGIQYLFRFHHTEIAGKREEKQAITRALVRRIKSETDRRGMALTFVFFPHPAHLIHQGWYEVFLHSLFQREGIDYVSMTEPLQHYLNQNQLEWWDDIYPLDSHPDPEQNALMADYLSTHLEARYGYRRTSVAALAR